MSKKISQFVTAICFLLLVPLLPLAAEYFKTGDIKMDSLVLCLAFNCFCLAFSTIILTTFTLSLMMGLIEIIYYNGRSDQSALPILDTWQLRIFMTIFVMHILERFYRHVIKSEKFLNFKY